MRIPKTWREIGCRTNGHPDGSLDWVSETLYITKTGRMMLHGEGGARSRYARISFASGNPNHSSGERITPLDAQATKEWKEGIKRNALGQRI